MNKVLYFFTDKYPFGCGEQFVEDEIQYLSKKFEKIILIPEHIVPNNQRQLPTNVEVKVFEDRKQTKLMRYLNYFKIIFSLDFVRELFSMKNKYHLLISKSIFRYLLFYTYLAYRRMWQIDKEVVVQPNDAIYYSYWAGMTSLSLAMLKKKGKINGKLIIKNHGGDLYFERHNPPYIPMRSFIYNNCDYMVFISMQGKEYFSKKHGIINSKKTKVFHLGSKEFKHKKVDEHEKFYILSCSNIIEVKRLDLIIDSLAKITHTSIGWTHIGEGVLNNEVKAYAKKKLGEMKNIEYFFTGYLKHHEIRNILEKNHFSIFINVSSSEGVPVSIMEAMSAGIPVIATDVGGVSEIVDESNGILLKSNPTISEVSDAIRLFLHMEGSEWKKYSHSARKTWEQSFNSDTNYYAFVSWLYNLT